MAIRKIFIQSGSLKYSLQQIKNRLAQSQKIMNGLKMKPQYRKKIEEALFLLFQHSNQIAQKYGVNFII